MSNTNVFLFLYPIEEYVQGELIRGAHLNPDFPDYDKFLTQMRSATTDTEREEVREAAIKEQHNHYARVYQGIVGRIITERYRHHGFAITYAVFDDRAVSPLVVVQPRDAIILAGLTFIDHTTERGSGEHPYPDPDHLLDQLSGPRHLRICGYHLWDCVTRVASRAHERGIDTLVDEDLTECLWGAIRRPTFRADTYPNFKARDELDDLSFEEFMDARAGKPWMWQKY